MNSEELEKRVYQSLSTFKSTKVLPIPIPAGKYLKKDVKGGGKKRNEIGYTKLWPTVDGKTDWALGGCQFSLRVSEL